MALKSDSKQTDMMSGYNATPIGDLPDCSWIGNTTLGILGPYVKTLQEVQSVRRKKPAKPVHPNYFKVHKFFVSKEAEDWAHVCYVPRERSVLIDQNRTCKWEALNTQPRELCELYKLFTENAVRDCYAKANSPRIFDTAPMLFELGETLAYLKFLLKGLTKLLSWETYRRVLSPESLWLEYRYAIMPLILTVSDVIDAFEGGTQVKTYDARITEVVKHVYRTDSWFYNGQGVYPNGLYDIRNTVEDRVSATCRLYVRTQCDPSPLGMGLWDMLRGTWEIVPLSFVVDWLFGVGDWLDSVRNTELEISQSYVTTVVDRRAKIRSHSTPEMEWRKEVNWTYHEYMMERKPDPVPSALPLLQAEKLSALRTADAISLLISFMKGILSRKKRS